jgi:hypothetical protein
MRMQLASSYGVTLTMQQQALLTKLKTRDQQVRAHEQAHLAASGGYAKGGATFSYEQGPDGQLYAVGGEVGIDTSPVKGDPKATIRKAAIIRAAAEAPMDPSSQDRMVAAQAGQMSAQAQRELDRLQADAVKRGSSAYSNTGDTAAGTLVSVTG